MAELSLRDRLQPSLLDRLTDLAPSELHVLVTASRAALAERTVTEEALRAMLRQAALEVVEERADANGDEFTLVLRAPEPFMTSREFSALVIPGTPHPLESVVRIGFRRVRPSQESRDERLLSMQRLRQSVLRDLNWLLNTGNLENLNDSAGVSDYPEVCRSVVNFGIPDITGMFARGASLERLERAIGDAIRRFEPRILGESLQVRAVVGEGQMNRRSLSFVIEGQLWAQPLPEQLYLQTDLDLGNGQVVVQEVEGGAAT